MEISALPGHELVEEGVRDLRAGRRSPAALLVAIGAPRLRQSGFDVPRAADEIEDPEHALYLMLAAEDEDGAHSRYNALLRRLVSFERALDCAR